jgi:hydroxyacylglutathione hydrolase
MKTWMTTGSFKIINILSGRSNVFFVTDGTTNILVDTSPKFMRGRLFQNLRKLDIKHIDYLVLTHSHFDHVANAAVIKEKYGARVIIHESERKNLETGKNPLIKGTNPFAMLIIWLFIRNFDKYFNFESCLADEVVGEHFYLPGFNKRIYLLHTPGHTPGSMSLIVDDEIALVGDAMFGIFPASVFPPFALNEEQLRRSWAKLLETGCRLFLPAHGSANSRELVERAGRWGDGETGRGL